MTTVHEDGGDIARLTIKRKRTKRQRTASPPTAAAAGELSGEREEEEEVTRELVGGTEHVLKGAANEDEDMANCLMLLAQGRKRNGDRRHQTQKPGFLSNRRTPPSSTSSQAGLGLGLGLEGVYQCKTCDRSFPSFQALGGHRASHKKPKTGPNAGRDLNSGEKKFAFAVGENRESDQSVLGRFLSLQVTSSSSKKTDKTHECSICKAEFSSGQALGGHMRRHRSIPTATANAAVGESESSPDRISREESKRQRNFLGLDLNLPAPEDDRSDKPKFTFASKDQILVFAAT
ncbi:PREDICTED: zinc finger protein ZAT5 [Tarenaya hassleriana]|uniref:zinc finger protein ZAT5 n=1 Tax=Tarenaya hassleriana TaxID=28532 RepID=UPI00053C0A86|nr:PREDICTED: zinc finger protein ZAT5 [Tarenaya hassleriana]